MLHHPKPIAELLVLFFTIGVTYQIWKRASRTLVTCLAVVSLAVVVGYRVWKHLPPYEDGMHDSVVEAQSTVAKATGPHIGNCPVFPADNVWNTPIDKMPKDPHAQDYVESIGPQHGIHPDFGESLESGIPYTIIPPGTKRRKITFQYRDDSDLSNYPIPDNVPIEGGAKAPADGDRHIILLDGRRCLLYEIYQAVPNADGSWNAGSGIIMDLTSNALRDPDKTSADAAGLPILPGLVRYDEVAQGHIDHALRFTVPHTQSTYVWPARHMASRNNDVRLPPMGTRFRLRADFNVSKYSKSNQVIMNALKKYGMFLADNGGAMFISGVSDKRWDDSDLHHLGDMKAEDFEAVDESGWQIMGPSGRVDPLAMQQ